MNCGVGRRRGSDPALLWPWHGPVAIAPIGPLAWEPPYAAGAALERAKRQKKKKSISIYLQPFAYTTIFLAPTTAAGTQKINKQHSIMNELHMKEVLFYSLLSIYNISLFH